MTAGGHPDEDTLLASSMGAIPPGAALVVHVHLSFCASCRRTLRWLQELGGALIEQTSPSMLEPGALDRALAAIRTTTIEPASAAMLDSPRDAIARIRRRPWRPFSPGLEVAGVEGRFEPEETVCLLKGVAGAAVPRHGHRGVERFVVLEGRFGIDDTVYGAGDFFEAGEGIIHTPFVPPEAGCICLFALEGGLIFDPPDERPSAS